MQVDTVRRPNMAWVQIKELRGYESEKIRQPLIHVQIRDTVVQVRNMGTD